MSIQLSSLHEEIANDATSLRQHPIRQRYALGAIALWLVAALTGMALLTLCSATPGSPANTPSQWPSETGFQPSSEQASIVVFLHPHCACSVASVRQLERALPHIAQPVSLRLFFYCPGGEADIWVRANVWDAASHLPGADRVIDRDGKTARQFGATTSGHICVFSSDGRLVFSGGITPGRGHEGDNPASDALVSAANGILSEPFISPAFGCPFFENDQSMASIGGDLNG
ncbi:MAG: hypothetical protein AB8G99_02490 [Planctomycetaceae bacterium]